jgi:hypothetical protein
MTMTMPAIIERLCIAGPTQARALPDSATAR